MRLAIIKLLLLFYLPIPTSISLGYTKEKIFLFSSFPNIFKVQSHSKQQVVSNNVKQLIRHKSQIIMWCRFIRWVSGQWHCVFFPNNADKILQGCIFPFTYDSHMDMETTCKPHCPTTKPEGSKYKKDQNSPINLDEIKTDDDRLMIETCCHNVIRVYKMCMLLYSCV